MISDIDINDEYILDFKKKYCVCENEKEIIYVEKECEITEDDIQEIINQYNQKIKDNKVEINQNEVKEKVVYNYDFILDKFNLYNFLKIDYDENNFLFNLTDEYPEEYITYYDSKENIYIYIFDNSSYSDVKNFFEILKYSL